MSIISEHGVLENPPPAPDPLAYKIGEIALLGISHLYLRNHHPGGQILNPGDQVPGAELRSLSLIWHDPSSDGSSYVPSKFKIVSDVEPATSLGGADPTTPGTWILMGHHSLDGSTMTFGGDHFIANWRKVSG